MRSAEAAVAYKSGRGSLQRSLRSPLGSIHPASLNRASANWNRFIDDTILRLIDLSMNRESIREGPNQHEQNNDFHSRIHSHFCKNVARTAGPGFANASPNGRPLLPTRLLLEKGDKRHENVYMRMKRLMKMLASVAYELRQCFAERRPASLDPPVSRQRGQKA